MSTTFSYIDVLLKMVDISVDCVVFMLQDCIGRTRTHAVWIWMQAVGETSYKVRYRNEVYERQCTTTSHIHYTLSLEQQNKEKVINDVPRCVLMMLIDNDER